jgi:hypothetical protein
VLARRQNLDVDPAPVRSRLGSVIDLGCRLGERDFEEDSVLFHHAGRVNLPLRADAFLSAALLMRFGLASPLAAAEGAPRARMLAAVGESISDNLYRELAREIGLPLPEDMKPFVMTLDAVRFDPNVPAAWPTVWPAAARVPAGPLPASPAHRDR